MPTSRFEPSSIKNKFKREEIARKNKRSKGQAKLQRRLALAKQEADDPIAKKRRQEENVPRTLDNTREYDPSFLTADPRTQLPEASSSNSPLAPQDSTSTQIATEVAADLASDPFADYFKADDPTIAPKVLITTSRKATKISYEFCDELVGVFPGAEFYKRPKGRGFEMGKIAVWAAKRGYSNIVVVNEDSKKPNAITMIHLPHGPTAYFKLTSVELTKQIFGHARATPHHPELVLNNFVTRLGHTVGRMFQTFFPPLPEFQGRQVVTVHNQRDFLFFRRHRYAFRSDEKVALQEIGPRFTLKLRSLRSSLPTVNNYGEAPQPLEFEDFGAEEAYLASASTKIDKESSRPMEQNEGRPLRTQEYDWIWKPDLETSKRTFFL